MLGIFPVGDLTEVVEVDANASAVILEEPEHRAPALPYPTLPLADAAGALPLLASVVCFAHVPHGDRV